MNWKPMTQASKDGVYHARDEDGQEASTWHDGSDWVRECWRETEDRQEYRSEEYWTPVAYLADA